MKKKGEERDKRIGDREKRIRKKKGKERKKKKKRDQHNLSNLGNKLKFTCYLPMIAGKKIDLSIHLAHCRIDPQDNIYFLNKIIFLVR